MKKPDVMTSIVTLMALQLDTDIKMIFDDEQVFMASQQKILLVPQQIKIKY